MLFEQLMKKWLSGQPLSQYEQQEALMRLRRLEMAEALFTSFIKPGTKILVLEGVEVNNALIGNAVITDTIAGGGDVHIDGDGVWMENNAAGFGFETTAGERFNLYIVGDNQDFLNLVSTVAGKGIRQTIMLTDASTPRLSFTENPAVANQSQLNVSVGAQGGLVSVDNEVGMYAEGASGGANFYHLLESTNEPAEPGVSGMRMYIKGMKLVIKVSNSQYFYIDLNSASNQQWTRSATAP